MPTYNSIATLDGVNDFTLSGFDRTFEWDERWAGYVSVGDSNSSNIHNTTLGLSSNWQMSTMRFWGWQQSIIKLTLSDLDDDDRRISFLELPDDTATLNLISTRIRALVGDGGTYHLDMGSARHGSVRLSELEGTTNRVELSGDGRIESLQVDTGTLRLDLTDTARIYLVKMDHGTYRVNTGEGNVESFYSHDSNNTMNIGAGGITQITMSRSASSEGVQVINAAGWIGGLNVMDNNRVSITTGEAGAGNLRINTTLGSQVTTGSGWVDSIKTGSASDSITIGSGGARDVNTGNGNDILNSLNGRVDNLSTGDGADSVTLGSEGAFLVDLGNGNDVVFLRPSVPEWGTTILGEGGNDTLNLSAFTTGIRIELGLAGQWQNIGAPDIFAEAPATGYVAVTSVENVVGGRSNDDIKGNWANNKLYGGTGNDTLRGDSGNDSLQGDAGKDSLTGGSGADSFIFRAVSESATGATTADVITDFAVGTDKINLSAIDAFAGTSANDTFIWKGTAGFNSTTKGEVRYEKFNNSGTANDYTMVWIDNDRDTGVEMAIRLTGLHNLTASDFVL
jgi:Ca2+-binding RTX toxin-like protein